MPLTLGTEVIVRTFGNKRGVIIAAGRNGQYRLRVEGITMWCREEDLMVPVEGKKKKGAGRKPRRMPPLAKPDEAATPGRIDLHAFRVEEAIAAVVHLIDHALRRGADRVEIVHGKGSGRIKNALHRHLASMPVVTRFELDQRNPGVTWVYF